MCRRVATGLPASIITVMLRVTVIAVLTSVLVASATAQTPQPFPRPGAPPAPAPRTQPAAPVPQAPATTQPADPNAPSEATLGAAIYPSAQFLSSYDAGRGQRYYVFGVPSSFTEVVAYYQKQTGKNGDLVFKDPPTHQFFGEPFARYRDETMVFPPGVTVKDWTAGGSPGYPNPRAGAQPARFPTILMIVTPPPATAPARRE